MFRHLLVLVVLSWVLVPHANAQESAVSDPIEYGVESADSVTFEFDARASADRIEMGESFTLEVSIVQKWWDVFEGLSIEIPGIEQFHELSEREEQNDFVDFRGVPTYDTVYYLELAPMRSGQFTLGPVVVEDENGQIMQSDPISVVVAEAKTSLSDTDPENLISFSDSKKSVSTMEYALPVLGTLCLLLIALYATIALTSRRPPVTKSLCVSDSPPTWVVPLPLSTDGPNAIFATLGRRFGRDVRTLTTAEILALEPDSEERIKIASLLDSVRNAKYAWRD